MASRSVNGGMYELDALTRAVNRRRGTQVDPVTADDVVSVPGERFGPQCSGQGCFRLFGSTMLGVQHCTTPGVCHTRVGT
jgi:hypothetical protein